MLKSTKNRGGGRLPPCPLGPYTLISTNDYMPTNTPSYNMRKRKGNVSFRIIDYLHMDYLGLATFTFML